LEPKVGLKGDEGMVMGIDGINCSVAFFHLLVDLTDTTGLAVCGLEPEPELPLLLVRRFPPHVC